MSRSHSFILLLLLSLCFTSTIQAQDNFEGLQESVDRVFNPNDEKLWDAYTEWSFKPGNNRVLGDGLLMVPLWQDSNSLIFADLRGQLDDSSNYEGNWGLGFRTITDSNVILGAYGFYDYRRTENNNNFGQVTFGLEALAVNWEARVNGYLPEDKPKGASALNTASFQGGTIFVQGGVERAYYGFDAEVGMLLRDWNDGDLELRGFAGGFQFDNNADGFQNIAGPRFRLELRGYDLDILGAGSRITLGTEYQWDQVREDQVYGMLQIRIPLGRSRHQHTRLQRRMLDRIVRDVDIVNNQTLADREIARDTVTNQLLTNVTVVDANTANVPGAVAGAGATVIANGSQGTINTNASVVTNANQSLIGGGLQVVGSDSGATATFGSRPTINNTNAAVDTVVVANGATVRGLNTNGGLSGIATTSNGSDDLNATSQILNNNVVGTASHGIEVGSVLGTIANNTTTNSGIDGFSFTDVLAGGTFMSNTATDSGDDGFDFFSVSAGGTFTNNTATDSGDDGFRFFDFSGNVANNTATNSMGNGFVFTDVNAGGTFTGNTATGSEDHGFRFNNVSGSFANNIATDSTNNGFNFDTVFAGGAFTGNTATTSGNNGFSFTDVVGNFANNTATTSGNNGFNFADVVAGGTFTNNTATDSDDAGFSFVDVNGNFTSNTSTGSGGLGFRFTNVNAGGMFTSNTATGSVDDGFEFDNISGTVSNNTATGSEGSGFDFDDVLAGGTFTNNTATGGEGIGFEFSSVLAGGTVSNNTATGGENNGFEFISVLAGGTFSNNTASTNDRNGIRFTSNSGTFTNNMSTFNLNNGFASFVDNPFDQDAGIFTGNVANNNGDMGFRGNNNAGTVNTNTGTGNVNGGNTFP